MLNNALQHPGPAEAAVRWLLDRDRQTRAKARTLYAAGWPWGEALEQAREVHCAVLWTLGNTGISRTQLAVVPKVEEHSDEDGAGPGSKASDSSRPWQRPQAKGKGKAKTQPCPRFNGKKGCTRRGRDCPEKLPHLCSKCGAWNHGAAACGRSS